MKKRGVIGYKGKIGSALVSRADFVPIDCDITDIRTISQLDLKDLDIIVNCAAVASVDKCQEDYQKAIQTNVRGLENIHREFGSRVLNIGSDHVFDGKFHWMLPTERSATLPQNNYGFTKIGAEAISSINNGKTIRASRTVSVRDGDIWEYLNSVVNGEPITVPDFIYRSYIHVDDFVAGIEYFCKNWDSIKYPVVNYAGSASVSFYQLMKMLVSAIGENTELVHSRDYEIDGQVKRPFYGGLSTRLSRTLGFPKVTMTDTVSKLADEYKNGKRTHSNPNL